MRTMTVGEFSKQEGLPYKKHCACTPIASAVDISYLQVPYASTAGHTRPLRATRTPPSHPKPHKYSKPS